MRYFTAIGLRFCLIFVFALEELRDKDFTIMSFHHLATMFAIITSDFLGYRTIGFFVLWLHDFSDIFIMSLKITAKLNCPRSIVGTIYIACMIYGFTDDCTNLHTNYVATCVCARSVERKFMDFEINTVHCTIWFKCLQYALDKNVTCSPLLKKILPDRMKHNKQKRTQLFICQLSGFVLFLEWMCFVGKNVDYVYE